MAKTQNTLTFSQKLQLMEIMKTLIDVHELEGKKYAFYKDDWNDESVAKAQTFPCTKANVQGLRTEMFGEIKRGGMSGPKATKFLDQIVEVNKRIDLTNERIASLERVVTSVRTTLGLIGDANNIK